MTTRPTILHISSDYPDAISQRTTLAIANLVRHTTMCNHHVYSLNRSATPQRTQFLLSDTCTAVTYPGLPYGVGLRTSLQRLGRAIGDRLQDQGGFDIIHAHKLTMEGIVAYELSRRFHKPMITTVRGETDLFLMRKKPTYRALYRRIIAHSTALLFLAPWTRHALARRAGSALTEKSHMLPNITFTGERMAPVSPQHSHRFITACRFDAGNYKRKRITTAVMAFNAAACHLKQITLEIAGDGESRQRQQLERLIASLEHGNRISLIGQMDNATFCQSLPQYAAFIRPSYPETFGMVFLEALFAGVPVLLARNTAIDGYFPDAPFAIAADHRSVPDVAAGIVTLYQHQIKLKQQLAGALSRGDLDGFQKHRIITTYEGVIRSSLARQERKP